MSCEYCSGEKAVWLTTDTMVVIEDGELFVHAYTDEGEYIDHQPVQYCMKCGSKLGDYDD